MRQEIQQVFNFSITIREVLVNTLVATVCGSIVSFFYIVTFRGVSYSVNFIKSIVMLSMVTAFVMMVIGDNLAQAFGMVGILSIIQFRSAMKGAQDFMFLFFALAIGLACGEGLYSVALTGCLLIGLITTAMDKVLVNARQRDFTLTLTKTASFPEVDSYTPILQSFCRRYILISSRTSKKDSASLVKQSYSVSMKNGSRQEALLSALSNVEEVKEVNLDFEEE